MPTAYEPRTTFTCAVCGEEYRRYPSRNTGAYSVCSRKCSTIVGNWERARAAYDAVRTMSEPERAWLAAAIDGEGCIGYTQTYPRITIVNTDLRFLERVHGFTEVGRIAPRRKEAEHHKFQWSWTLDGYGAAAVLEQVVHWLVIKQDKAIDALATRLDSLRALDDFRAAQKEE